MRVSILSGGALLALAMSSPEPPPRSFDLEGHRGARGLRPENTLPAFAEALARGVSTLELDTAVTRDGVVVVSHDAELNPDLARGPDGAWLPAAGPAIHALTFAELGRYDVGRIRPGSPYAARFPAQQAQDGTRIPRLADVFALAEREGARPVRFNVETKLSPLRAQATPDPEAFAAAVVSVVRAAGVASRTQIQSFDWRTLAVVRRLAPELDTVCLTSQQAGDDSVMRNQPGASPWLGGLDVDDFDGSVPRTVQASGCRVWSPDARDVTADALAEAHALGLRVVPWTVNEPEAMARSITQGADGLISDRPDILRDVLVGLGRTWIGAPDPHAQSQAVHLHYGPADRAAGRYQYVPVDVPTGTGQLDISVRYPAQEGANALDLGLFEPGPLDSGTTAFRGWSGSNRDSIRIGAREATPGYWPGPLPAGRWHVLLGLYKVADGGADVELTVATSPSAAAAAIPPPVALAPRSTGPLRPGPAWFSGGLHLHTLHSDGTVTAAEVARLARADGLDFIVITDHNNTTHQLEPVAEPALLRMVGEEVTTPAGHASVWGLGGARDYVDFRVARGEAGIDRLVAAAHARGALFSINHPKSECAGCSWEHAMPEGVDGIEVANAGHPFREAALALWDSLLQKGRRVTGVGASDWHRGPGAIGRPSVRVRARDLSEAGILEGIRKMRVVVMADGRTPPPELSLRAHGRSATLGETLVVGAGDEVVSEVSAPFAGYEGATVQFLWDGARAGRLPLTPAQPARLVHRPRASGYMRVEVTGADGQPLAITNPVFVEVKASGAAR